MILFIDRKSYEKIKFMENRAGDLLFEISAGILNRFYFLGGRL